MWQTNSHDKFLVFTFKVDLVIFTLDVVVVSKLKVGGMPIVFAHKKYEKSQIFSKSMQGQTCGEPTKLGHFQTFQTIHKFGCF